jgi:hypothetical protein
VDVEERAPGRDDEDAASLPDVDEEAIKAAATMEVAKKLEGVPLVEVCSCFKYA